MLFSTLITPRQPLETVYIFPRGRGPHTLLLSSGLCDRVGQYLLVSSSGLMHTARMLIAVTRFLEMTLDFMRYLRGLEYEVMVSSFISLSMIKVMTRKRGIKIMTNNNPELIAEEKTAFLMKYRPNSNMFGNYRPIDICHENINGNIFKVNTYVPCWKLYILVEKKFAKENAGSQRITSW